MKELSIHHFNILLHCISAFGEQSHIPDIGGECHQATAIVDVVEGANHLRGYCHDVAREHCYGAIFALRRDVMYSKTSIDDESSSLSRQMNTILLGFFVLATNLAPMPPSSSDLSHSMLFSAKNSLTTLSTPSTPMTVWPFSFVSHSKSPVFPQSGTKIRLILKRNEFVIFAFVIHIQTFPNLLTLCPFP